MAGYRSSSQFAPSLLNNTIEETKMSFIRIQNIQTRDCYYPIYLANGLKNHGNGFYFYDEEIEEIYNREGDHRIGTINQ